jgi:hypothetical protein
MTVFRMEIENAINRHSKEKMGSQLLLDVLVLSVVYCQHGREHRA